MGFAPLVSPALRLMDGRLFHAGPMALHDEFLKQAARPRPDR
jgi:acyl CoA:acetate/3-ketoacid CoA transferase